MVVYYSPTFAVPTVPWKWRNLSWVRAEQKRFNKRKKQRRARCGRNRK